jgi:hypothetical protein
VKPKIAELERQLDRGDSCSPHSGCADAYRRAALPALLRLARAAKEYRTKLHAIRDAIAVGNGAHGLVEAQRLADETDAALDAFDWSDA